jgi:hypothetical protein
MCTGNALQFADGGHLCLAAAGSPTLGNIENEVDRLLEQMFEKRAAAPQQYRLMTAFAQGGCDGVDGFERIVLFEPVVGTGLGSKIRIIGFQVVRYADQNGGLPACAV